VESKAKDKKQNRYQMTGVGYQQKAKGTARDFYPGCSFCFFLTSDICT